MNLFRIINYETMMNLNLKLKSFKNRTHWKLQFPHIWECYLDLANIFIIFLNFFQLIEWMGGKW